MCEYENQVWDLKSKVWQKSGLNTFKTCKIVKKWTLDAIIKGLPQARELQQSSYETLDYMAQL